MKKPTASSPLILSLTAALLALPVVAQAQFTFTTNDGAITITKYTGPGGEVTIPGTITGLPVTDLGYMAFRNCTNVTGVTLPNSVTNIGNFAFCECTHLAIISIPSSVSCIGTGAFQICSSLVSVTLPEGVTKIADGAFMECAKLASVTIPNSVTSIGGAAFYEDPSLTSLTFPPDITSVEFSMFCGCSRLTNFNIPNGVTNIGQSAFCGCSSLASITIPNGVTGIGYLAFASCSNLASLTIPNGVSFIDGDSFRDCTRLTNVTIPGSVTNLPGLAFYDCPALTALYFKGNAPSLGSMVFSGDTNATVYYLAGTTGWGPTFGGLPTALWSLVVDPFIATQPASQNANPGDTAGFSVTAGGTRPFAYQWRKESRLLAGATVSSLTLTNVQWADAGSYDVVVSNSFGVVTSAVALLTVNLANPDTFNPSVSGGAVYAAAIQTDGMILLGGTFTSLGGQPYNHVGRLNADGTADSSFNPGTAGVANPPDAAGVVYSLVVQGDGKILVAGNFTTLGGESRTNIGRLNSNGTVDPTFNAGTDSSVYCLAVQADGKLLVGGHFTTLGGQPRTSIGRLNSDGTVDTSFNPGAAGEVYALAVQADGKIVVGGIFSTLGGQPRTQIGRLNANGTLDTAFNPGGANSYVCSLAVQTDGKIVVGGIFSTLGGQSRSAIGRLNANGTLDTAFNPGANSSVSSLALQADGKILVGGSFTTLGGQPRNRIGRLTPSGTLDNSIDAGTDGSVFALALQTDGKFLAAGSFTTLGGQPRKDVGRLNNTDPATQSLACDGNAITWLRGGTTPEVWRTAFEVSTDNGANWLAVGGGTRISGGWQATGLAVPTNATLRARGFVSGAFENGSGWVVEDVIGAAMVVSQPVSRTNNAGTVANFTVLAGGTPPFSYQWLKGGVALGDSGNISGAQTPTLTLSNVLGGDAGGYSAIISNRFGSVTSLLATLTVVDPIIGTQPASKNANVGDTVSFSVMAVGTAPLTYRWRKDGATVAGALGASLTLTNVQIADAGGYDVVVGNSFGTVTSVVAALTVARAFPDTFNPGMDSGPRAMAIQADGKILVGGQFLKLGGATRIHLGRLNADGTLDAGFNPEATREGGLSGPAGDVCTLAVQADGKILVGGHFTMLGGQSRTNIGRLYSNGTVDTSFNPGANNGVWSLAVQADGKIVVGGSFTTLGGQPRTCIGRLNSDGTVDTSFDPQAGNIVYTLAVQADGKIVVCGAFTTLNGQPRNRIGRLNADGTLDTSFNPGADADVYALAVQADGKIVVGGNFAMLGGAWLQYLGRLNTNGTLDTTFHPGASRYVNSLAAQADGKILVGGAFTTLGGQTRNYIGRLNGDGTVDGTFNPGASGLVTSLALQEDGKIVVAGAFTTLGGMSRTNIGRLNNTDPATQSLSCDGHTLTWLRGGTGPEVWCTSFDASTNGTDWISLGAGARITGGWGLAGVSVPGNATIRARGLVAGGGYNASSWYVGTNITTSLPFFLSQPVSQTNNVGTDAAFSVLAGGTPPLGYQWRKDGTDIAGATASLLTLAKVKESDQGAYCVVVSNSFGAVTCVPALLVVNQPPVADAGATRRTVISANGVNARVLLNGLRSSDPDGDRLQFAWYEAGWPSPLAQGVVALVALPVGSHSLALVVDDGGLTATNAFSVEVISVARAVERLISQVNATWRHPTPLVATLEAGLAAIERGNRVAAINQLLAFQLKVRAQVKPGDSTLAATFIQAAQDVIDALRAAAGHPAGRAYAQFAHVIDGSTARATVQFSAEAGGTYVVEASTDLVTWEAIGLAQDQGNGRFAFEDINAAKFARRYYRIKQVD